MTFNCPRCGASSENPTDEVEGYCGRCRDWTGERARPIVVELPEWLVHPERYGWVPPLEPPR